MIRQAKRFTPLRLTTSALLIVTFFRANNTAITARQFLQTGEAKALIKAFFGFSSTMTAMYFTGVVQTNALAQIVVQQYTLVVQRQVIVYRLRQLHFLPYFISYH